MTEDKSEPKDNVSVNADLIQELRNETAEQIKALKESFEAVSKEKDEMIAKLSEDNEALKRALVRSAVTDPPKEEAVKSEEELYKEKIDALARKSMDYMRFYT